MNNGAARDRIAAAFDAAREYESHARVQREVAADLAADIARLPLPPAPRILELGCGTGFLTRGIMAHTPDSRCLITDISPAMLERCRASVGARADVDYVLLDAERGTPPDAGKFDLVCSSLAVQWFDDPAAAIGRMAGWVTPGGHLLFTSLLSGTFAEWRAAHAAEGLEPGLRALPDRTLFDAVLPQWQVGPHMVKLYCERHASGRAFLRALRAIGADTPAPGHAALGPGQMRRVLRRFDVAGDVVSYDVITCHYRRSE